MTLKSSNYTPVSEGKDSQGPVPCRANYEVPVKILEGAGQLARWTQ